jgi:hypothetical protein
MNRDRSHNVHNQPPKIILGVRLTEGTACNAPNRQEGQRMQLIDPKDSRVQH